MLDQTNQELIVNRVTFEAELTGRLLREAHSAPSAIYKPSLYPDGLQWCALYGANIQEGVAGFGASPEEAMLAFDRAWATALKP